MPGDSIKIESEEETPRPMFVNVIGVSVCTREFIRSMRERGVNDGHIVHFGRCMLVLKKVELESKIKITNISPGFIYMPMVLNHFGREVFDDNPYLYPEDVADAVVFVLGTPPHVQIHDMTIKPVGEKV